MDFLAIPVGADEDFRRNCEATSREAAPSHTGQFAHSGAFAARGSLLDGKHVREDTNRCLDELIVGYLTTHFRRRSASGWSRIFAGNDSTSHGKFSVNDGPVYP